MTTNTQKINAKSVAKYMFLPGIIPRAKELGSSGFGYLAFLFACVYRSVRILPSTHPFVNPDNIGKFGIVQVISAAANRVEFKRGNIDQIIVFFALLAAVILMAAQFVLLLIALFSGRAFASPPGGSFTSMFLTPHPETDIAFLLLDYVFGIPADGGATGSEAFFGSNALVATGGPTPFHLGMHALFNFYNLAILLVAVLIFLYYIVIVVMETAQTGVPFGQRFSKIYAPFRLIFAIGLLVPLSYGFNGAQYITLYLAKLGSSFATNGWVLFNENVSNPAGTETSALVAKPKAPILDELLYFSSIYHACREGYSLWHDKSYMNPSAAPGGREILPYIIVDGKAEEFFDYSYQEAKDAFGNTDMEVVLGELHDDHKSFPGNVRPYCGRITISLNFDNPEAYRNASGRRVTGQTGIRRVENSYYYVVVGILRDRGPFPAFGERMARLGLPFARGATTNTNVCYNSSILGDADTCPTSEPPGSSQAASFTDQMSGVTTSQERMIQQAYEQYRDRLDLTLTDELARRGWGGAGIWYNTIADVNGAFTGAVYATPSVKNYPELMEEIKRQRQASNVAGDTCNMFEPNIADGQAVMLQSTHEEEIAKALNATYKNFACEKGSQEATSDGEGGSATTGGSTKGMSANVLIDTISLLFGMNGLFDIRTNSEINPATGQPMVHPLAQLSTVGKSLVENAIRSMGMAIGAAFGSGIAAILSPHLGQALMSASSMFVGIATIGLTAGFILYYILPFLPFIYFFFAVTSWVKSIFEAMVGVPLWALAHLKIDGDGFSGRQAAGGYFLLFEIFLRPIVTVFGLIGGMAIFGALAGMLNVLFDFVIINITGAIPGDSTATIDAGEIESLRRGTIDQFFFTIMYAVLLYLMATSSFKLIDTIPKGIMRWIGSSVSTFNDNTQDPASGLTRYAAVGGSQISGQIFGGITQGIGATSQAAGNTVREAITPPPNGPN